MSEPPADPEQGPQSDRKFSFWRAAGACADAERINVDDGESYVGLESRLPCETRCVKDMRCMAYQYDNSTGCYVHTSSVVVAGDGTPGSSCYIKVYGHLGTDSEQRELELSNRWLASFLGFPDEACGREMSCLCRAVGWEPIPIYWLALQVATGFAFFYLCLQAPWGLCLSHIKVPAWCWRSHTADQPVPDLALEGLSRFEDVVQKELHSLEMLDRELTTRDPLQTARSSETPSRLSSLKGPMNPQRPNDLRQLEDAMKIQVAMVREKWKKQPANWVEEKEQPPTTVSCTGCTKLHVAEVYWGGQLALSCILLLWMGVSMSSHRNQSAWSNYCLFCYAFANTGMVSSGVQMVAWLLAPRVDLPWHPVWQAPQVGYKPMSTTVSAQLEAKKISPDELNRATFNLAIVFLPVLLPLGALFLTHTVAFAVCYPWVILIVVVAAWAAVQMGRFLAQKLAASLSMNWRYDQIGFFVYAIFATVLIQMSASVMTSLYAGEWQHGGYFDRVMQIVFTQSTQPCAGGPMRSVDFMLRWT